MKTRLLLTLMPSALVGIAGCAASGKPPPEFRLDEPPGTQVQLSNPAVVADRNDGSQSPVLAGQLKPLPGHNDSVAPAELKDEKARVARANQDARVAPTREGFINAVQVWPYADGALYQVYTSPGRVTLISMQQGEELVAISAGDTVRWVVGDTVTGTGSSRRVSILVKPIRTGLKTNLVLSTNRRTYLLELSSTPQAWMASVSWEYPKEQMVTSLRQSPQPAAVSGDAGLVLEHMKFRYAIKGDSPPWKPLRAFDDGEKVYIEFPRGIAQGELPPLFVVGPKGEAQLVNHRFRSPFYVVDRLFGAAELRLGAGKAAVVRVERNDSGSR